MQGYDAIIYIYMGKNKWTIFSLGFTLYVIWVEEVMGFRLGKSRIYKWAKKKKMSERPCD